MDDSGLCGSISLTLTHIHINGTPSFMFSAFLCTTIHSVYGWGYASR